MGFPSFIVSFIILSLVLVSSSVQGSCTFNYVQTLPSTSYFSYSAASHSKVVRLEAILTAGGGNYVVVRDGATGNVLVNNSLAYMQQNTFDLKNQHVIWFNALSKTLQIADFSSPSGDIIGSGDMSDFVDFLGVNINYMYLFYVGNGIIITQANGNTSSSASYDISDLANIKFNGFANIEDFWFTNSNAFFANGYGFFGSTVNASVQVYDFKTDPLNPKHVHDIPLESTAGVSWVVSVDIDVLYLHFSSNGNSYVFAVNVSDPLNGYAMYKTPSIPHSVMYCAGNGAGMMYAGTSNGGIYAFNVSDFSNVKLAASMSTKSLSQSATDMVVGVAASANYVYAGVYNYMIVFETPVCNYTTATTSATSATTATANTASTSGYASSVATATTGAQSSSSSTGAQSSSSSTGAPTFTPTTASSSSSTSTTGSTVQYPCYTAYAKTFDSTNYYGSMVDGATKFAKVDNGKLVIKDAMTANLTVLVDYSLSSYSSYAIDSTRNVVYWYDVAANALKAGSFANFAAEVSVTSVSVNQIGSLWYSSMKYVGKGIVLLQYNQQKVDPFVMAFNFSNLANPTFLGNATVDNSWFDSGYFVDGYGYVGTRDPSPTALLVYDFFTNPLVPTLISTFNISSEGGSMYILGMSEDHNTVYINRQYFTAHVYAVDITQRTTPSVLYMLPMYIVTVAKVGNTLWVGTDSKGLYVYDVSATSNITLITVNDVLSRAQGTNNQVVSLSASSKYVFASIYNYVVAYSAACITPISTTTGSASSSSSSSSTGSASSTTGTPSSTTGSSANATVVVQVSVTLSLSGDPNAFNKRAFIAAFAAELGIPYSSVNLTIILEAKRSVYAGFKVLVEAKQTLPADTPATVLQQFNATAIRTTIEAALVSPNSPLRDSVSGFTVGQVTASTTITENNVSGSTTTTTAATTSPVTTTTGNNSASSVALSFIVFCLAVLANL